MPGEYRRRLRRLERHHLHTAGKVELGGAGQGRAGRRQIAQKPVQQDRKLLRGDVAYHANMDPIARQRGAVRRDQVLAGKRAHALLGAGLGAAIGMIPKDQTREGIARDLIGILVVRANYRQNLFAHPLDCIWCKSRLHEARAEQFDRLVPGIAQEPRRNLDGIIRGIIGKLRGDALPGAGKALGIHVAGAFLEKSGHQVDRPALARRVERGAAAKAQLQRHKGQGVFLHEPRGDAARAGHFLDLDAGARRHSHDPEPRDHCVTCGAMSQPVTDLLRSRTRLAAATTSSAVTA